MARIEFSWNSQEMEPFLGGPDSPIYRATVRSLRRSGSGAIRAVRAEGKRQVRARKRMRAEFLANSELPLVWPSGGSKDQWRIDRLVWQMKVGGREVPVGKYPARQVRAGVSVMINKGQRKLIKGAFIATMKSGHRGVFMRTSKKRLPIDHALSTRTSDVFSDEGFSGRVLERGGQVFQRDFERILGMELRKMRAAGARGGRRRGGRRGR